jgi:hypothetical protein
MATTWLEGIFNFGLGNLFQLFPFKLPIGRLHAKVPFLEQNQNQLSKNYIAIVNEYFVEQFTPYMTGEKVGSREGKFL